MRCPLIKLYTNQVLVGLGEVRGGVCGVEMALWDLAGKAYNVPAYQMLSGKFREKVRLFADTNVSQDPKVFAERLRKRKDEKGFTSLKMDVGIWLLPDDSSEYLSQPLGPK